MTSSLLEAKLYKLKLPVPRKGKKGWDANFIKVPVYYSCVRVTESMSLYRCCKLLSHSQLYIRTFQSSEENIKIMGIEPPINRSQLYQEFQAHS